MALLGSRISFVFILSILGYAGTASAGVRECHGLRLENVGNCEIKGSVECTGGCAELGIYEKACATKLHRECRQECTLSAEPTCTDECTVSCQSECDAGVSITCQHNCFGECIGSCETTCAGATDAERCNAECEATCDGHCDVQCAPVVDASCYTHCIECCGGSCGAQANMDCQTTCQDREFETCEYEFRAECDASCSADGAIFCDGEYVLSGSDIPACVAALVAQGTATADLRVHAEAEGDLHFGSDGGGCSIAQAPGHAASGFFLVAAGAVAGSWLQRRRRNRG